VKSRVGTNKSTSSTDKIIVGRDPDVYPFFQENSLFKPCLRPCFQARVWIQEIRRLITTQLRNGV